MLDREDAEPKNGDVLPPLWHWLYFLPVAKQSDIGDDGHPKRGGFLPPVPLPRRMWAGGRLQWHAPLRVGDTVHRRSTVKSINHKVGRTGELLFVLVAHEIHNAQGLCITEEHDIVYRPLQTHRSETQSVSQPVLAHTWARALVPDDTLLFRYSALTFNAHRIHYDRRYCQEVEAYPGLVVHGPLLATLLMDLLHLHSPHEVASFEFKALHPCFECADHQSIHLFGQPHVNDQGVDLWVQDHHKHINMQATAFFRHS